MDRTKPDVLLHPVRLRIVLAIAGEELTTAQIGEHLADVPPATLYRHVAILAEAGLLEVVKERRSRGGVERTYRLVSTKANIGAEGAASMSRDEHMAGFLAFVGALVGDFGRYVDHPESNPGKDTMGYRQAAMWLTENEQRELLDKLVAVLEPYLAHEWTYQRSRSLLSTILIPDRATAAPEAE